MQIFECDKICLRDIQLYFTARSSRVVELKSISYLLKVETTVPISLGSHDRFPSGFLEWKVKTLQVIILQECA